MNMVKIITGTAVSALLLFGFIGAVGYAEGSDDNCTMAFSWIVGGGK